MSKSTVFVPTFEHRIEADDYSVALTKDSIRTKILHVEISHVVRDSDTPIHLNCGFDASIVEQEPAEGACRRIIKDLARMSPGLIPYLFDDSLHEALCTWLSFYVSS